MLERFLSVAFAFLNFFGEHFSISKLHCVKTCKLHIEYVVQAGKNSFNRQWPWTRLFKSSMLALFGLQFEGFISKLSGRGGQSS